MLRLRDKRKMVGFARGYQKTSVILKMLSENILLSAGELLKKKNPDLYVTTEAINGSPKLLILNETEKFGAELIVVGSHGCGTIGGSYLVPFHSQCPYTLNVQF